MFSREQNVLQFYVQGIQSIIATHFGTYYFPQTMGRILEMFDVRHDSRQVPAAYRLTTLSIPIHLMQIWRLLITIN